VRGDYGEIGDLLQVFELWEFDGMLMMLIANAHPVAQ